MSKTELFSLENEWRETTIAGNGLFKEAGQEAIFHYENALDAAERLMVFLYKCIDLRIPVMPMFLISCNNLAAAYSRLGKWDKAEKMLKRGVYYILFLKQKNLHPQVEPVFSRWLCKQMLHYSEFSLCSGHPEKFRELLNKLKDNGDVGEIVY